MKKLLFLISFIILGMAAGAGAYTQSADNIGSGGYYIDGGHSYSYAFDTPSFTGTATFANIILTGSPDWLVGASDIKVGGVDFGSLNDNKTSHNIYGDQTYQIDFNAPLLSALKGGQDNQPLLLTINKGGIFGMGDGFTLDSAVFNFEYSNSTLPGDNSNAPVPEPATLLLLGSGLVGLAFWGKQRKVEA